MIMMMRMINSSYKSNEFGSFRMWQKHYQNKAIYWRETLKMSILEQNAEIVPGTFSGRFFSRCFCCKFDLFWASRRFSLLQTLCARRYEKRTQQAELVGKTKPQHGHKHARIRSYRGFSTTVWSRNLSWFRKRRYQLSKVATWKNTSWSKHLMLEK